MLSVKSKWKVLTVGSVSLVSVAIFAAVAFGAGNLPIIGGNGDSAGKAQLVAPTAGDLESSFQVFRAQAPDQSLRNGQQVLRNQFGSSTSDGPARNADFARAVSVPISGQKSPAWIAPSGNEVCVYIPDPVDGFGASCATPDQIASGSQIVTMPLGPNANQGIIVVVPVVDGEAKPTLISQNGSRTAISVTSNLAAVTASKDDSLQTANGTVPLSRYVPEKFVPREVKP